MPNPVTYEVLPMAGAWTVRIAGDSMSESYESKLEAVSRAHELAHREIGRVRVLTEGGAVEEEFEAPEGAPRRTS